MKLDGIGAIVTGGASGLGAATARLLIHEGANVAILDRDDARGRALATAIGAQFIQADISEEQEVVDALAAAEKLNGVARVLVNCAGVAPSLRIFGHEGVHPIDAYRRTIEVNLIGTFLVASRFAHRLRSHDLIGEEAGVIINVASIAATDGHVGHAAYSASKAGVIGLTLPMTRELCAYAIRVMAIAPGLFDTPMLQSVPGSSELATQVPHPRRFGEPAEFAAMVKCIIENPMLNGDVIPLDGGLRLAPQ